MKTAIIIHGYFDKEEFLDITRPAPSNDHWFPWIQKQLLLNGVLTQTPEMPEGYLPRYEKWKAFLEQFDINEETILVGHSCGGGFLVRWLSENNVKVGRVVLVAPWLDPKKEIGDFFNFALDEHIVSKTKDMTVMYSTDDFSDVIESVAILKTKIQNLSIKEFTDKGHFVLNSMKTDAFPELLSILLK